MGVLVKMTQAARKRHIGVAHVRAAIESAGAPVVVPAREGGARRLLYVGVDDRGVELEVIAIEQPELDRLLIVHVMPYRYRRNHE